MKNLIKGIYLKLFNYKLGLYLISYSYVFIIFIYNFNKFFNKKKKLLVITSERFRNDLGFLEEKYSLVLFPKFFQNIILFPIDITKQDLFFKKLKKKNIYKIKKFISNPLLVLKKILSLKSLLSPSIHYYGDTIFFYAANLINLKKIVIHRENFGFEPLPSILMLKYYSKFKTSYIDLVFTCNDYMTNNLKKIHFLRKTKIITSGSYRGYKFYQNIKNKSENRNIYNENINIVFLSFTKNTGIALQKNGEFIYTSYDKNSLNDFFYNVHNFLINYAHKNKKIKLTIKTKWKGIDQEVIKNWYKTNKEKIKENITISSSIDYYETLLKADIIIAFGASSILESGILNVPVIIPFFDEAKYYKSYFNLKEYRKSYILWDRPNNLDNIVKSLNKNLIDNKMSNRIDLYKKYICNFNSSPSNIIINNINKFI